MMNFPILSAFFISAITLSPGLTNTSTTVHLTPPASVQPPSSAPVPLRLKLTLTDSSQVIGVPSLQSLALKTSYADVQIPLERLRTATFSKDHAEILTVLANGDRMTAVPKLANFQLTTIFGKISVELRHIISITVLSGGSLASGLVAYWTFDGNGQDSIGNHTLVKDGNPNCSYVEGVIGQAMKQEGNSDSFHVENASDINLEQDFTISFWAFREKSIYDNDAVFDSGSVYIAKRDANPWNSRMGVALYSTQDKRAIDLVDNSSLGEPPLHTWFHVVVFRSGDTVGIKVNNAGSATVDLSGLKLSNRPVVYLGKQKHGYSWNGRLDEFGIWNRALTSSEIESLYNDGKGRRP